MRPPSYFAIVVAGGLLAATACGSGTEPVASTGAAPPTAVKIVTVRAAPLEETAFAAGAIEARHTVELLPETSGTVVAVHFDDGQEVRRGDLLVELRDTTPRAQLDEAEARLDLAAAKHGRIEQLFGRHDVSKQELDQALAEHELAKAAVALAREALRKTEIRAPFDGVVGRREVSIGAAVGPSTPITRVEDLSTVTVDVGVPERLLPRLAIGQEVHVRVDAWPEQRFAGTVRYVAPRVDEATRTLAVRAHVDNAERLLRPGMSATVEIVTAARDDALLVPTQAVMTGADGASVFVADADDVAQKRKVTTGVRKAASLEITDGLQPGDRVIVEGLIRLTPGAKVAIVGEPR